jgi:hypothetical protein
MRSGRFSAEETELTQLTVQVNSIDEVTLTATILAKAYEPHHPQKDVQMAVPYELLEQARPRFNRSSSLSESRCVSEFCSGSTPPAAQP